MRIINSKAEELWYRIISRKKVSELAKKFRKEWNIPKDGFGDRRKTRKFVLETGIKVIESASIYIKECRQDAEIPKGAQFDYAMLLHLIDGHSDGIGLNFTGCELDLSEYKKNGTISIKIGINSTIEDLKEYIKKERGFIGFWQKDYRKKHKLKNPKKIRGSKNHQRDALIYFLSNYTKNELLRSLNNDPQLQRSYKESLIKKILKEWKIDVSAETVRTTIARQKKLREKQL